MKLTTQLLSVALTALLAASASAAPISGLGAASSNAALTGGTVISFDSTASGTYANLTIGGVTFSANGPMHVGTDYAGNYNTFGTKSLFDPYTDNGNFTSWRFDFASGTNAFGFNWGAADQTWTLRAYDSSNGLLDTFAIAPTHGSNAGEYFGLAIAGISYATLSTSGGGDWTFIDNFTYNGGGSTSVPDGGATALLLGAGLLSLAAFRRRQAA